MGMTGRNPKPLAKRDLVACLALVLGYREPLHVVGCVGAPAYQGMHMVNFIARAGATC